MGGPVHDTLRSAARPLPAWSSIELSVRDAERWFTAPHVFWDATSTAHLDAAYDKAERAIVARADLRKWAVANGVRFELGSVLKFLQEPEQAGRGQIRTSGEGMTYFKRLPMRRFVNKPEDELQLEFQEIFMGMCRAAAKRLGTPPPPELT